MLKNTKCFFYKIIGLHLYFKLLGSTGNQMEFNFLEARRPKSLIISYCHLFLRTKPNKVNCHQI